jgi:lambda family phage tail tape measure protein
MAQNIARLGVVLGIDTAQFTKGLGQATLQMAKFVEGLKPAIGIGSAAMTGLIAKTIAYADKVTDLADANDMAISSVMGLSSALSTSGGRAENAGKMLSTLSTSIDKITQGVEGAEKPFQRLGISIQEIASSSTEQLLKRVAESLAKVEDATTRNALAREIFSKAGMNISWDQFSQALEEQSVKFKESEAGIRAMAESADMLSVIWGDLMASIAKGVGTNIKEAIQYFSQFKEVIETVGTVFRYVFETMVVLASEVIFVIQQVGGAIATLANMSLTNMKKNGQLWEDYANKAKIARYELDEFQKEILKSPEFKKASSGKEGQDQINRQIQLNDKQKEMLRVAGLISQEYERQQSFQLAQMAIRNSMEGMTENERKVQEAINQVLSATSQKLDEIAKKREDAAGRGANAQVLAEYDKQIEKVKQMQQTYVDGARIVTQATIDTQRTFEYGWNKAFNQYAEDAYNYGRLAEDMFKSFTGNMTSAIDEFVETGKFSFSNFAESIIKDLIKIQLRMSAMQMFSSMGGGLGGIFGGLFGGGASAGATGSFVSPTYGGVGMAADGGMISGPTVVGENGPELFIPQRSGTVIPNQQLSSMNNQQPTIVYNGPYINQMSAIDTQSATQFLAQNKNAVWSANQSASRGMPTSR